MPLPREYVGMCVFSVLFVYFPFAEAVSELHALKDIPPEEWDAYKGVELDAYWYYEKSNFRSTSYG
jgi:hypothetical protein